MYRSIFTFSLVLLFSVSIFANERSGDKPTFGDNPRVVAGPIVDRAFATLNESFEGASFPPAGWIKVNPDGGSGWEQITVGTTPIPGWGGGVVTPVPNGMGGSNMAFATWNTGGPVGNEQWLMTPQITGVQTGDELSFWLRKFSNLYSDTVYIKISTTDTSLSSFSNLDVIGFAAADTGWNQYTYNLDAYNGQDVHIAFVEQVNDNFNNGAAVFVDLVSVGPAPQTARVQVIHNSADAAAAVVDVWLNDQLLLDDFAFRTASPFIDAPAGVNFDITIQPSNSMDTTNGLWRQTYQLADGETYVLIADGIVSPTGYTPATPFDIYVYGMGQEAAAQMGNTDVLVFHGATDAPTVDVVEVGVGAGTIVDDISFGQYQGYLELGTLDYRLDVRDATGTTTVATYDAPLATLGLQDQALVVFASGFLDPSMNSNGEAFGLWVALANGTTVPLPVYTPSARAQVIHNSADSLAAVVDVWLNDALLLDDFAFRTASPFIDAPAGVDFDITIQPANSMDTTNGLWRQTYQLADGETYILIADGIVSPSGYTPATPFDIYVYPMGQEMAAQSGNTDVLVFHGATDAPTVDVVEVGVGAGTIVNDISFGEYQGYLELGTLDYRLDVRDATGTTTVATYDAPLATLGLQDEAIVVFASGFLTPANNSNGPAFGLWVALANGAVVPLPEYTPSARAQVIHNSADAAAAVVDVWLNDALLLDDFAFRTASPFIDAPAGVDFDITIQPANSMDTTNGLWRQTYQLADGETYILIADGIVSPSGYTPATAFDIFVYPMGQEMAAQSGNTDVLVFHGSTDAPTVDVVEVGVGAGTIVDDISFGEYQGYLELGTIDYRLDVRDSTGMTTVATYDAPLATLGLQDEAIVVFASGFLNPAINSNGEAFGLWVALANGATVPLPVYTPSARAQVIHNSADAAAAVVDVWLNDALLLDDFAFRTASPFIDAPAGVDFDITIQPSNSMDTTNGLWRQTYQLADGETYILIADGIVSSSGYSPATPFDIYVYGMGREQADSLGFTDVLVFHGATDAPTVDVVEVGAGAGTIVDDISFGEYQGYLTLGTADYRLDVRDMTGMTTVATYDAPLATLGLQDSAIVVFASGFLTPANNSNGPAFGLWVALANGTVVPLPEVVTSISDFENAIPKEYALAQNYPNPFNPSTKIKFALPSSGNVTLKVYDVTGKVVATLVNGSLQAGEYEYTLNGANLASGIYFYRIQADNFSSVRQMVLIK